MARQSSSSSSYDVFISFRGSDTRLGFTGNLYKALSDRGIHTFIDDKELKRGEEIKPSLLKSIEDSRVAIIIFSEDYASSSFCLDELVHIIYYFKKNKRLILPVFYGVEPSQVRHQNDFYGEALANHEKGFQNNKEKMERLQKWKNALKEAADLSGHHFNQGNQYERDFIERIVTDVSKEIIHVPLHVADYIVGLKSRVSEVNSLLDLGYDGVCIIGIYGTGGIGKTTLAQTVYNLIEKQFDFKCILHNVRENSGKHGLEYLQEQLLFKSIGFETKFGHVNEGIPIIKRRLSQKKVLLILDDVNQPKQLENLVGEPGWLGSGSRVIITTRDKQLLSGHGITRIYKAGGLNKEEALELLRKVVFKSNKNDSMYDNILNRAVEYASGLPLALKVVGSNLFGRSIEDCESLLDKYKRILHEDIQNILKVSFDALDKELKNVFLDIACVFKGAAVKNVIEVLRDHYGYSIENHLQDLVDKSLIYFVRRDHWDFPGGSVTLHDLIEDMGEEIVRQESIKEPGERSRLWCRKDIVHVLKNNKGTSKIEMIFLNSPSMERVDMNEKAFKKMTNLKTLIIQDGKFSKVPKYLPSSLVVCKWIGCPSKTLTFFSNQNFENMKNLILDCSQSLIHIPNVSGLPNLIKFSFENCRNLITIDNSIWKLNKLEHVSAKCCQQLESFPPLHLPSLKELELSYCDSLKSFPELLCQMTNIKKIEFSDTSIGELPFSLPLSFQYLSELEYIELNHVRMLRFPKYNDRMNPIVFSKMDTVKLVRTDLSDECLPILLKWFVNVTSLNLRNNDFKVLPECLSECHHLMELVLDDCKFLEEIRGFPPNLVEFSAVGCESLNLESRRRLLSQDLHDAGCTTIRFPNRSEGIPDWFEHQIRGNKISFWFSKKVPTITCIFLIPRSELLPNFDLFLDGKQITDWEDLLDYDDELLSEHAFLFDLKLDERINRSFANKPELYEAVKNKAWNHVKFKWGKILSSGAQMGIHVSWYGYDWSDTEVEKSNKEGEVRFTNPYCRKRKLDEYLVSYSNTWLSQFEPPLKKQRLVELGVSETERM